MMVKLNLKFKKEAPKITLMQKVRSRINSDPLLVVLIFIFILALASLLFVFSAYFSVFTGGLTTDHEKWGTFGDFVGGTLNPILAFLSFLALLFTIWLQSRDLKISNQILKETQTELEQARKIAAEQAIAYKNETEKNDIIKAIDSVHSEIKELFKITVDFCPDKNTMGWFFSNSAPSVSATKIPKNGDEVTQNDRILLADISEYMMELSGYLHEYISKFGASSVSFYYQRRYLTAKTRLVDRGFLIEPMLQGFHSPGYGWSAPTGLPLASQSRRSPLASAD